MSKKSPLFRTLLKIVGAIALLLVVLTMGLVVYAKYFYTSETAVSYYVDELPLGKNDFSADFEEIFQTTRDNCSLLPTKHIDLDSLHRVYAYRVSHDCGTAADYGECLKSFFAALHIGHAGVCLKDFYAPHCPPIYVENRLFLPQLTPTMRKAGFKENDEIIAIDGQAFPDWLQHQQTLISASTAAHARLRAAQRVFYSWRGKVVHYQVVRGQDTLTIPYEVHRKWKEGDTAEDTIYVTAKVLHDSVGYLRLTSMMPPVLEQFKKAYSSLRTLPYLIIDIRENGGGNSSEGKRICEYLLHRPQPHCLAPQRETIVPRPEAYRGKLFLLIGPYTFSAAESFAIDLKESGEVTLIGEPTGGDTGNGPEIFHTSHHLYFRLPLRAPSRSPQGFPLEGVGLPPHHEVHPTVADVKRHKDTVLEYTLTGISTSKF